MKRKFKLREKVRILWDRTGYHISSNYMDIGEVKGYHTTRDGTPSVELYNFHKHDKYHSLGFPISAVRPLKEVIKDGDTL